MKSSQVKLLVFLGIFMLFTACKSSKENTNKAITPQPNIVFVFADDWGYGDLGCYGNTEVATPNLDKMAAEGTRFTQFHVTSGVCSPSRSTIITGHYPARHGVHAHFAGNKVNAKRGMPNYLNDSLEVYLPKLMQQAGYTTAHFGKWHLGGGGKPHGDPTAPEPKEYGYDVTRVWNGNGPTWKGDQKWPTTRFMDKDTLWVQSSSKLAVNATIDFLKDNKEKQPMFVNLWLKDPHTPLWPSDEQRKPYKGLSPEKETYYAVLTDADYHIGRLMKAIQDMGLDENTLVVFSSDNGPSHVMPALKVGSTGGLKGRKVDVFQGGVDVPFIVRWPGKVNAGIVDTTSVLSSVDLLPTFADLAQATLPQNYKADGEVISSIFNNKGFKRTKPLFWEWRYPVVNKNPHHEHRWPQGAVRNGDWKLLFNDKIGRVALYNIAKDPFEKSNIAVEHQEKVKELKKLWKDWKETLPE